ncbi:MAG TPA: S-layer homology domain-containing protein [Limnochordales bacterium]
MRLKGRFSALGRLLPLLLGFVLLASGAASAATAGPFSDVPAEHWAYDALEQLSEAGLVDGYPSGFFSVSRRLTRYEMALSVVRALERLSEQVSVGAHTAETMDVSELWLGYNEAHPDRPLSPALRDVLGSVVHEFEPELMMLGYGKWTAVVNRAPESAVVRVEAAADGSGKQGGAAQVEAWERRIDANAPGALFLSDYVLPGTPLLAGARAAGDTSLLRSVTETWTGLAGVVPVTPYLSLRGERALRSGWDGEAGMTSVGASVRLGDVSVDGRLRSVEPGFGAGLSDGGEAMGVGLTVPLGEVRLITGRDIVQRLQDSEEGAAVEHVTSWALEYGGGQSPQVRAQWESVSLADLKQARSRASVDVNVPVAQGAVHLGLAYEGQPKQDAKGISVTTLTVAGFDLRLQENAEAQAAIAFQDSEEGSQRTTSLGLRYTLSPEAALRLGYKLINFTDENSQNVTTAEITIRF